MINLFLHSEYVKNSKDGDFKSNNSNTFFDLNSILLFNVTGIHNYNCIYCHIPIEQSNVISIQILFQFENEMNILEFFTLLNFLIFLHFFLNIFIHIHRYN